jgi:hypothetical protein
VAVLLACALALSLGAGARPVAAATTTGGSVPESAVAAAPCGTPGAPTTTIFLPNITKMLGGPNGWVTPFIVQNVGVKKATLEVSFFRFSDGALVACRRIDGLAPATSFADFPNNDVDLPPDAQFSVVVKSFGSEVVSVVNEHQGLGTPARQEALSYNGLTTGATTVYLPFVGKPEAAPCTAVPATEATCNLSWVTTFVMQNFGTVNTAVTARFTSYDGSLTATLTRTIAPGRSQFIDPSAEPQLRAGRYYSVVLTSPQPIGVVANAHDDAPSSPAPRGFSYNGVPQPTNNDVFLPYVRRDGAGLRTYPSGVLVQNAGASDARPTLAFQRLGGGGLVSVTAPAAIKPGAVWLFDPEQTPALALGEYSLVVSGGTFAVLDATLVQGAAMGFIGAGGQGNRAYLPNITRTLGGVRGWTTPIIVQSTGATSATLRWYRFSDGALITRHSIGPFIRGASIRVDPRSVPALSDDTQYGVVVDAQDGNIAAVVTELNFEGGDGTMIYEGFAATVSTVPTPTALTLAPASLRLGTDESEPLIATVKDQFDVVMPQQLPNWSVLPQSLGSVSSGGVFTASASGGIGTITATSGSISETIPVSVQAPTPATVGGLSFLVRTTGAADVYAETSITRFDAAAINVQVNADVLRVQQTYARSFAGRPQVYVLATDASYRTAQTAILGIDPIFVSAPSSPSEFESAGVYYQSKVAIDWARSNDAKPFTVARHELTHMIIDQTVGGDSLVPAWLNEGSARLEEFTIAGAEWWQVVNRSRAMSMAVNSRLFTTQELTSQRAWNAREGLAATYQYAEAQQIVQLLRDEVGISGIVEILRRLGAGETFEEAYQALPRRGTSDFSASVAARIRAQATSPVLPPRPYPTPPGIDFAADSAAGPGAEGPTFVLWGFAPSSSVTLSIRGAATGFTNGSRSQVVDEYGTYWNRLGTSWPADTYTFTVTTNTGLTIVKSITKTN